MILNYRKQLGSLVFGQIVSLLLSFILPLILVRILTQNDYGLFAQFNVILAFCTSFFSFGISTELYFFYPILTRKDKNNLVFQSLLSLVIVATCTCLLLYIPPIRRYFIKDSILDSNYIYLVASIFLSIPEIIITALYVQKHDNKLSALYLPINAILRVGIILLLYCIYPTVKSIFIAILISCVLKFVFTILYSCKDINKSGGFSINKSLFKNQLKYALPLGLANSIRVLVQQMDKIIVLSFVTPAAYAIYSIAFYGVPGLIQVYLSISQVYIPRMTIAFSNSDKEGMIGLYHSMVAKTLSYTIPIVLIVMLFASPIISFLFSPKYLDSTHFFQIYLLSFIISSIGSGNILKATGKTKKMIMPYLYIAIPLLFFTYFAIKNWGLNGAILSALLGAALPKIILSFYDANSLDIKVSQLFPWKSISKILSISGISLIPFVIIYFNNEPIGIISTIVCILTYGIIVVLVQLKYNVFVLPTKEVKNRLTKYTAKFTK